MKKFIYVNISIAIFIIFMQITSHAQPGTLDPRFGDKGKIYEKDYRAAADVVAVQRDGKILAAGNFYSGVGLHVSRYNSDGSLDENFADAGRFILRDLEGYGISVTQNMLLQQDGKIVVGARSVLNAANRDVSLIRLNTDGSLDNSFGGNGIVDLAIGPYDDEIGAMALQQDGKILVAGLKDPSGYGYYDNKIPMLLRLKIDGSYDESFGEGGKIIQNYNGKFVNLSSILLLSDGKIIMGGDEFGNYDAQVVMFKYNTDGTLDSSFGIKGIAESRFLDNQSNGLIVGTINDLLVLPDGKIFACGESSYSLFLTALFNVDGTSDTEFGEGKGYKLYNEFAYYSRAHKAYFTKGNKILITGTYANGGFATYRFFQDGSLDSSYGTNGLTVNYFEVAAGISPRGSAVQPDGKIIQAGSGSKASDDYSHICMMRLHGDGGITPENYVRIKRWMKKNGFTWPGSFMNKGENYQIERSTDGIHFTTIASVNKTTSNSNEYAYEDPSPVRGNNYYRVAYKNETDKVILSNVIAIKNNPEIKIYPNPVVDYLYIQGLKEKTKMSITDIKGTIKMVTQVSSRTLNWNVAALTKGYYILKIETSGKEAILEKFYKE